MYAVVGERGEACAASCHPSFALGLGMPGYADKSDPVRCQGWKRPLVTRMRQRVRRLPPWPWIRNRAPLAYLLL
jgi:hypothetical protein